MEIQINPWIIFIINLHFSAPYFFQGKVMQNIKSLMFSVIVTGLILCGCNNDSNGIIAENNPIEILLMTQSDFSNGLFQCLSLSTGTITGASFPIFNDAKVFTDESYVYILELYGADNLIKLDPSMKDSNSIIYIKHLGNNWNPQDIKFIDNTKAYISNMDVPNITVFNPSTGEIENNIDLSQYAYLKLYNESPYAADMQLVGTDLYVLLQRRNEFVPGASSQILKIDTKTDQVTDSIQLINMNGIAMAYYDSALYVTNAGDLFTIGDGAVEKVNLADKKVTIVIDEMLLDGSPYKIIHEKGSLFYVSVYIGWRNVPVLEIDASNGTVVNKLPNVKDAFGGIMYDENRSTLYVGERDTLECGVRVFKNNKQSGDVIRLPESLPVTNMCIYRPLLL